MKGEVIRIGAKLLAMGLAISLLTGGMCGEPPAEVDEEEQKPAAERLQQPRNMYDGNVNQNLRELRQDLEETAQERQEGQNERIEDTIR